MHAALAQQRDTGGGLRETDTDGVGVVCVGLLCVADQDQRDTAAALSVVSDADGVEVVCVADADVVGVV